VLGRFLGGDDVRLRKKNGNSPRENCPNLGIPRKEDKILFDKK